MGIRKTFSHGRVWGKVCKTPHTMKNPRNLRRSLYGSIAHLGGSKPCQQKHHHRRCDRTRTHLDVAEFYHEAAIDRAPFHGHGFALPELDRVERPCQSRGRLFVQGLLQFDTEEIIQPKRCVTARGTRRGIIYATLAPMAFSCSPVMLLLRLDPAILQQHGWCSVG